MKVFFKKILLFFVKNKLYFFVAIIYRCFIFEKKPTGINTLIYSSSKKKVTILALDSERYRGDLDVLSSNSSFRILHIKNKWQGAIIDCLYDKDNIDIMKYSNASKSEYLYTKVKRPAQEFMRGFIKKLTSTINIDCVVNVNYRYINDYDWTLSFEKIGIPYIMLYRECLLQKDHRFYYDVTNRHKRFKFHGSHIIVHGQTCKDTFIESSFIGNDKISVAGALRMDKYLKNIKYYQPCSDKKRKKFVLFYFPYNMSLFGKSGKPPHKYKYKYAFSVWKDRESYFKDIHCAIVELSKENPDIDFVIKPKKIMTRNKSWEFYKKTLTDINFDINKAENYFIEPDVDVHELILSSDVICALQSSTAIEAAISGKPVILPVFENYRSTKNYKDFSWKNYIELFDVADNKEHFKKLIIKLLKHPDVDKNILKQRERVFKSFFYNLDGSSLKKYSEIISNVVKERKDKENMN